MEWLTLDLLLPSNAGIIDFPTYLLGTIFTILFPGPNSLYVLTITTQKGWRFGAWGTLGIFIGDSILMIAIALGAASLLLSSPLLFNAVRTSGASKNRWRYEGANHAIASIGRCADALTNKSEGNPFLYCLFLAVHPPGFWKPYAYIFLSCDSLANSEYGVFGLPHLCRAILFEVFPLWINISLDSFFESSNLAYCSDFSLKIFIILRW